MLKPTRSQAYHKQYALVGSSYQTNGCFALAEALRTLCNGMELSAVQCGSTVFYVFRQLDDKLACVVEIDE